MAKPSFGKKRKITFGKKSKLQRTVRQQAEKLESAWSAISKKLEDEPPPKANEKTRTYFSKAAQITPSDLSEPGKLWKKVRLNEHSQVLIRTSRRKYIEALALVAWLWEELRQLGNKQEMVEALFKARNETPNAKRDVLGLIADTVINYGPEKKIRSRDALAIRHLLSIGVKPEDFGTHFKTHRGGVDAWARAHHKEKKTSIEPVTPKNGTLILTLSYTGTGRRKPLYRQDIHLRDKTNEKKLVRLLEKFVQKHAQAGDKEASTSEADQ